MKGQSLGGGWFVYGILRISMAVVLVVFSATAHLMFGTLLNRVPRPLPVLYAFDAFYWVVIAWCVLCALLSFLAAGMLFVESQPARKITTIAAFLSLPDIPFGLVLGTFTLLRLQSVALTEPKRGAAHI